MWGTLDTGETDPTVAVDRLTDNCLRKPVPDIVYYYSSAGFQQQYCQRYSHQKICSGLMDRPHTGVDQRDPANFIYDLYGCTKEACKRKFYPYDAYLSRGAAELLKKVNSLPPRPDDGYGCADPSIQTGNNAGFRPSRIEIDTSEPPAAAQSRFSVDVTLTIEFADNNVEKPKLRYYLVREHGLWFIDDIVSDRDSLVDDLKSCR